MNLFSQTIAGHIGNLVDQMIRTQQGGRELRIFTQSMPPAVVLDIFRSLHDILAVKAIRIQCITQVSCGLYNHWTGRGGAVNDINDLNSEGWIDLEDRLTHFRNLLCDKDHDLLIVLLVGIDHATDRGGLGDFYTLSDESMFRDCMGGSYRPWIQKLISTVGVADVNGATERDFEKFLQVLFSLRPRNLIALSQFLGEALAPKLTLCDQASQILVLAFENLPFWGLPPLMSPANPGRRIDKLVPAARIFSRTPYREARERAKAQVQISNARENLQRYPENYNSTDEFLDTLIAFVEEGSQGATDKLLNTDFVPVIEILQGKTTKASSKQRVSRLRGPFLTVILSAVFESLAEFVGGCKRSWAPALLNKITIELESFEFDGTEEGGVSEDSTAETVLNGLIGGVETFINSLTLDLKLESSDISVEHKELNLACSRGHADKELWIKTKRIKESRLSFWVQVETESGELSVNRQFVWVVPPHHEERVRLSCAELIHGELKTKGIRLPVIQMTGTLDEMYFALDDAEAHRLLASGLTEAKCIDVLAGFPIHEVSGDVARAIEELAAAYREFISAMVNHGAFTAFETPLIKVTRSYRAVVALALRQDAERLPFADDLLRRLYQAFLCVPEGTPASTAFLPAAIAIGITPAVAESVQAREVFLRDGFSQVAKALLEDGVRPGRAAFDRMLGLVALRRPLYGLVFDSARRVTTTLRSFGLIHRLGERPAVVPSLAAQAEMRSDESGNADSLSEYLQPSPESRVITQTLRDYQLVHPYASDRIDVLAANVEDLRPLLGGVDEFLRQEFAEQVPTRTTPFLITVRIVGRGPSATAAQDVLRRWQEHWREKSSDQTRPCRLTIFYRAARNREDVLGVLNQMDGHNDVAFLFNFLNDQMGGDSIVPAERFVTDYRPSSVLKFPVCEHPRPVKVSDPHVRQALVSNRRFTAAAKHAEITARLKMHEHPGEHHLVFNQVEFGDFERKLIRQMHKLSRWVACLDRFVDKELILNMGGAPEDDRKIVGFSSGVGAYGELNLTLSTESNTPGQLFNGVITRLGQIFRLWTAEECRQAARQLVDQAQKITGLSLVRALHDEGAMRDIIGYAIATRIYLDSSTATMCAAIPLDSFAHWFDGAELGLVPDLLLLEARIVDGRFSIDATIVECKVAQESAQHAEEAVDQAAAGLKHLSQQFMPRCDDEASSPFDRRYWWAQIHRALVVRNVRRMHPSMEHAVDHALERLTEGDFDIHWRGIGATFWTNDEASQPDGAYLRFIRTIGQLRPTMFATLKVFHAAVGQRTVLAALKNQASNLVNIVRPVEAASIIDEGLNADQTQVMTAPNDFVTPIIAGPAPVSNEVILVPSIDVLVPSVVLPAETTSKPESVQDSDDVLVAGQASSMDAPDLQRARSVPERILLGRELSSRGDLGNPIYWEYDHPQLSNRHLLVFGTSGFGKTYTIQALLLEMAKAQQTALVIDYTDGFLPGQLESELKVLANPEIFALAAGKKLPLDPFGSQTDEIEGIGVIEDTPFDVAKRVASIFTAVYSSLGEQQKATLVRVIEEGVTAGQFSLQALYDKLLEAGDDVLANKIMPLARTAPFSNVPGNAWDGLFNRSERLVSILQLTRIPSEVQRLIIEFALWDLWDYMRRTGKKSRPLPVVLDEVQNLDHSAGSPLEKFLREGRKFGASMILATQTLSHFDRDERDRLFQAAHKLFFQPAQTEVRTYAMILKDMDPNSSVEDWTHQLLSLKKGECLSVGPERRADGNLRQTTRRIAITALEERIG